MRLFNTVFFLVSYLFPNVAWSEDLEKYGAACAETIGVEVPEFRCDDPRATVLDSKLDGKGGCLVPSHGGSRCFPGTRFLKYTDTFEEGGKRNVVETLIMCRKQANDGGPSSKVFSDIAVIQYNRAKNASCWFSRQAEDVQESAPPPYRINASAHDRRRAERYWGPTQPNMDCRKCHETTFLRTPFAALAPKFESGKGYVRQNRSGAYQPGNGNSVPEGTERLGPPCHVALPEWNSEPPLQLKINEETYLRAYPNRAPIENQAAVSTCTSCHYIGKGRGGFTCGLALESVGVSSGSRSGKPFPHSVWMPPKNEMGVFPGITQKAEFDRNYQRAIEALRTCCENPDAVVPGTKDLICRGDSFSGSTSRKLLENGACSLLGP